MQKITQDDMYYATRRMIYMEVYKGRRYVFQQISDTELLSALKFQSIPQRLQQ